MAAICTNYVCGWEGRSDEVDMARCPECGNQVRYEARAVGAAVVANRISDPAEFTRRALVAVRGCALGVYERELVRKAARASAANAPMGQRDRTDMAEMVRHHRREIHDHELVEYAETHGRGY